MTNNKHCIDCGKKISYRAKRCEQCYYIYHSKQMMGHKGLKRYGKDNPNWKNGISTQLYPSIFCKELKELIRNRDNYTCQICGKIEKKLKYKLAVHHINYDKNDLSPHNLISLCKACHSKTNGNRKYWQDYCIKKLKNTEDKSFNDIIHDMKKIGEGIKQLRKVINDHSRCKAVANVIIDICDKLYFDLLIFQNRKKEEK